MLLFHGGLPRSGKSYESIVEHLIPALKKGRKVYARIDGLNYEKIAELAEITLERCQDLLVHLTEEQVSTLEKNPFDIGSLIIIDEAQNYWQDARKALSPELTKFVAEHGHKGLDILLMGQEFKDLHKLWKNRVSQRVQFVKLDMVGKANKYSWVLFKATHPQKFLEVTRGSKEYDAKYFGTYKSFEEGAEANQLYSDKRANVFNSKVFRRWLPLYGIVLCFAAYFVWRAFYGDGIVKREEAEKKPASASTASTGHKSSTPAPAPPVPPKEPDFVGDLTAKYRFRVTAIIKSAHRTHAIFEWYDDSLRIKERVTMLMLAQMGYKVVLDDDMQYAIVTKGKDKYIATQFPSEPDSRMSNPKLDEIAVNQRAGIQDRDIVLVDARGRRDDVVASADGWGVLGKAGPGVRYPSSQPEASDRDSRR